ncbi:MAG TPA: ABC transporter permease [Terriglobales bacterium]|nr:ABC transporter permease [Terriglobales bacterium]
MKKRPPKTLLYCCRALLWLASWLVPAEKRQQWWEPRDKEVWHWLHFLAESERLTPGTRLDVLRHCWGAFPEALWQRFDRPQTVERLDSVARSPLLCLGVLGGILLAAALLTGFGPTIRSMVRLPYADPGTLFAVRPAGRFMWFRSDQLQRVTHAWSNSPLVKDIAAYSFQRGTLSTPSGESQITAAQVAPNFFQVLGVPAMVGRTFRPADAQECEPCVVLSEAAWQAYFASDPQILGKQVKVDGREMKVLGVLPRRFSFASPQIAAWSLLQPSDPPAANLVERMGAVARVTAPVSEEQATRELQRVTDNAGYHFLNTRLQAVSLLKQQQQDLDSYLFFVLLAALGSVLVAWVAGAHGHFGSPARGGKGRWWGFFIAKTSLLLMSCFVVALELAHYGSVLLTGAVQPMSNVVSMWVFLVLAIGALSWAIYDQRRRCRVCLRRLGLSVHVGCPGYTLLDCWGATELVCARGHGSLYMPDSEASWMEGDQWSNLDTSLTGKPEPRHPA